MKTNSTNPFQDSQAEEPIIRPLEQRRVPSATGAAFALPVLPEADDEAPVEEVPADFEAEIPVEGEVIDELLVIDPLPIDFEDVIEGVEAGDGEVVIDDGAIEEFNPDVIFYTIFQNGEPLPFEGEILVGEDGIGDGEPLPIEGEILGGEEGIGDGEPLEEVPAFIDKDGDGFDDVTGESEVIVVDWTDDWVKRGDGETTGEGEEINPEIYYTTGGGPVPTAGEVPDTAPETTAGDPAPAHHAPAVAPQESVTAQADTAEVSFEVESATPSVALPVSAGQEIIQLDEITVPSTPVSDLGEISHDSAAHDLPIGTIAFGSASIDTLPAGFAAIDGDHIVDSWVPAASAGAELVAHFDGLTAEAQPEHAAVVAPVDAGATANHGHSLRGSVALAATGAVLLSRDARKREDEEQA